MNDEQIKIIIRDHIKQNPGKTINKVAEYLTQRKVLSYVPARNRVIDLIHEGIIEDRKKGNSFHSLYVNDKNDFNIIDNQLNEIEYALNLMDKPIRKIVSQKHRTRAQKETFKFREDYDSFFTGMLRILLEHTAMKIRSEKYSQMLYDRISMLMVKVDSQFRKSTPENVFVYHNFYGFEDDLNDSLKKMGIDAKSVENLRTLSKNFKHYLLG